jgi:hypothetical protein
MLFDTSLFHVGGVARAIRTAVAWGAEVISMSFGYACDNMFCDLFFEDNIYAALRHARDNGCVLVAAAGNSSGSGDGVVPCKADEDVICVGALADNTNVAISYSNSGNKVDIWAPTNIRAIYGEDPSGGLTLTTFGGTSASCPFVAGVCAVLKAYDPTLTSAQVTQILRDTAWTDSPDPKVTHYINAYAALRRVLSRLTDDPFEPNDTQLSATNLGLFTPSRSITLPMLNLATSSDVDLFRFDLDDYALVCLGYDHIPALGNIQMSIVKDSTVRGDPYYVDWCPPIAPAVLYSFPPGRYWLRFSHRDPDLREPNVYTLRMSMWGYDTLTPDSFEPNNTFATARSVEEGAFEANIDGVNDVDYYSHTPALIPGIPGALSFRITTSDMLPLTLTQFNASGDVIQTQNCNDIASCSVSMPTSGTSVIRVDSHGVRGRYTFQILYSIDISAFLPDFPFGVPVFWIDRNRPPFNGFLKDLPEAYLFKMDGKASRAILYGKGLRLRLLDKFGNIVLDGTPVQDIQLPYWELSFQSLDLGEYYILWIERDELPTGMENEAILVLPYQLQLL